MLQKGNLQKDHKILWSFCYSKAVFSQYLVRGYLKLSCVNLSYYDQMSILLERLYTTGGDAEKYELEIKKINDISVD